MFKDQPLDHWRDDDGRIYVAVPRVYSAPKTTANYHIRKLLRHYEGLADYTPVEIEHYEDRDGVRVYREAF